MRKDFCLFLAGLNKTYYNTIEKIIDNFDNEIKNFFQVCPKEMINKLKNPITSNPIIKEAS